MQITVKVPEETAVIAIAHALMNGDGVKNISQYERIVKKWFEDNGNTDVTAHLDDEDDEGREFEEFLPEAQEISDGFYKKVKKVRPRILIEIEGGNVQGVICTSDNTAEIFVMDYDHAENADAAENPDLWEPQSGFANKVSHKEFEETWQSCKTRCHEYHKDDEPIEKED